MRVVYAIEKKLLKEMYGDWENNPRLSFDIFDGMKRYVRATGVKGPLYVTQNDANYYIQVEDAYVRKT